MYRLLSCIVIMGLVASGQDADAQRIGQGNILMEYWWGDSINSIDSLTASREYAKGPGASEWRPQFDRPDIPYTNYYGARARGYITPPTTGDYRFWVHSSDEVKLWLSLDNNQIGPNTEPLLSLSNIEGVQYEEDWRKYPRKRSGTIRLKANTRHYFEALFVDRTGPGVFKVSWEEPGIQRPELIDSQYLSPYIRGNGDPLLKARNPVPANGSSGMVAELQWTPGQGATAHHIFLGTTPNLTEADLITSQDDTVFSELEPVPGTTYYWRVDEGLSNKSIATGEVWSFSIPPMEAHNPSPPSGLNGITPGLQIMLGWSSGFAAVRHRIHFGNDYDTVAGTTNDPYEVVNETSSVVGPLRAQTIYYWRVDEVQPDGTIIRGPLWRFSTTPADEPLVLFTDDFEAYNNDSLPWTGPGVGHHIIYPFSLTRMETRIVYSGNQSLPLYYGDQAGSASYEFPGGPEDWTSPDPNAFLSLYVQGRPENSFAWLSVALVDNADNFGAVTIPELGVSTTQEWYNWTIPLREFSDQGVNLEAIRKVSLGAHEAILINGGNGGGSCPPSEIDWRPCIPNDWSEWILDWQDLLVSDNDTYPQNSYTAEPYSLQSHTEGATGFIYWDDVKLGAGVGTGAGTLEGYVRHAYSGAVIENAIIKVASSIGTPAEIFYDKGFYWTGLTVDVNFVLTITNGNSFQEAHPEVLMKVLNTMRDLLLWPMQEPSSPLQYPVYRFKSPHDANCLLTGMVPERDKLLYDDWPHDKYIDPRDPNGWQYNGIAFCAASAKSTGAKPVHRFRHKWKGAYFYTLDPSEADLFNPDNEIVWVYEGEAFLVYPSIESDPAANVQPVYHLWSEELQYHYYTIDPNELGEKLNEKLASGERAWQEGPKLEAWYALEPPRE